MNNPCPSRTLQDTIRIEVPSRICYVAWAGRLIADVMRIVGFKGNLVEDVRLAVHEAMVNAIRYGNEEDPKKFAVLTVELKPEVIRVCVEDEGEGFDKHCILNPLSLENLDSPRGRGVFLMESFMDEVNIDCHAGTGTHVRLTKYVHQGTHYQEPASGS